MNVKLTLSAAAVISCVVCTRAEIVEDIKDNVCENWRKIQEKCQDVRELAQELPNLPDDAWFFSTDKDDQRKKIHKLQEKIRKELLSVDSCEILAMTDKLSRKIAEKKQEIAALQEKRGFVNPEKLKKLDEEIKEEQEGLQRLTAEHSTEMTKVKKELSVIGLQTKGDSLNVLSAMRTICVSLTYSRRRMRFLKRYDQRCQSDLWGCAVNCCKRNAAGAKPM